MSAFFPNPIVNNNNASGQVVNVSMLVEKPCPPPPPPLIVPYVYESPIGWNAVLVGLLSSILAILFLLTCLYYLAFRRRLVKQYADTPSPVPLVEKNGASSIPVTTASQTATTTFINEANKETKISSYSEQCSAGAPTGNLLGGLPSLGNGHSAGNNGLLTNGLTDPSELRLLQHEHH